MSVVQGNLEPQCIENKPLASFTTFKIGGIADKLYKPANIDQLMQIVQDIDINQDNPLIIGAGSNLLVSSQGHRGKVIYMKNLNKMSIDAEGVLSSEAGAKSAVFANFCKKNLKSGLEFLIGIPGTVGGAVYMNCSACGQWISDSILDAQILDLKEKKIITIPAENLDLKYRHSNINSKSQIILSARFKLTDDTLENIESKMEYTLNFRNEKQPKGFNAGSMFKNPSSDPKMSSGSLIDSLGAKGWTEGGAEVSHLHANFIENFNNATSLDISRLLLRLHLAVKDKYGIKLTPEVKYVGEPTKEEEEIWKILLEK